jgi:hypothetical protein
VSTIRTSDIKTAEALNYLASFSGFCSCCRQATGTNASVIGATPADHAHGCVIGDAILALLNPSLTVQR